MRPGAFQAGHVKQGGRQKGTLNKAKQLQREAMERACARIGVPFERLSEIRPLQAMQVCLSLSLEAGDRQGVLAAAGMMAPYIHAKLSAAEVTVKNALGNLTDSELLAEARALELKMAGRLIEGVAEAVE
jgi:hypothetical protein